jgi:hypothetical protein
VSTCQSKTCVVYRAFQGSSLSQLMHFASVVVAMPCGAVGTVGSGEARPGPLTGHDGFLPGAAQSTSGGYDWSQRFGGYNDDFAYRTAATADQIWSNVERPSFRRVGFGRALSLEANRPAEVRPVSKHSTRPAVQQPYGAVLTGG